MKRTTTILIAILALCPIVASAQYTVNADADNDYAIYSGSSTAATSFYPAPPNPYNSSSFGNQYNLLNMDLRHSQSYSVTADPSTGYIYIAAWSDLSAAQGLIADVSGPNGLALSGNPGWQVAATGILLQPTDPPPTLADLTTEIGSADINTLGVGSSGGWVTPTVWTAEDNLQGGIYTGAAGGPPGIDVAGINDLSDWMWYNNGTTANPFFPGQNEDEYLIFRLSTTAVPEPTSVGLIVLSAIGALGMRRRKTA